MKYEVGDVVVLKDDGIVEEIIRVRLNDRNWDIDRVIEETLEINIQKIESFGIFEDGYYTENHGWLITDEMIERKATTKECIDNGYSDISYGDRVRVLDGGIGALGANGLTGVLTDKETSLKGNGLLNRDEGMVVECDNGEIWKVHVDAKLEKVETESKYNFSCDVNVDTSGLQEALRKFRKFAMDKSYLRVPVNIPEEVIKETLGNYGIQTLKLDGSPIRSINPYQWLISTDTIKGMSADKIVVGNWKEENNEEEDNMNFRDLGLDKIEGNLVVEGKENGFVVKFDANGESVEVINEIANKGVENAFMKVLCAIRDKRLEEKDKEYEIKSLEEKLAELKGE